MVLKKNKVLEFLTSPKNKKTPVFTEAFYSAENEAPVTLY